MRLYDIKGTLITTTLVNPTFACRSVAGMAYPAVWIHQATFDLRVIDPIRFVCTGAGYVLPKMNGHYILKAL